MAMNKVKLAPNLAMKVAAKYIDLFPGDHGPSVRLKGKFDGEDGVLYLPGDADDALSVLTAAGIIPPYDGSMEPAEAVNLKPKRKEFELILAQAAGEKYGKVQIVGAPPPSTRSTNGNGAHAPSSGATVEKVSLAQTYIDATKVVLDKVMPLYVSAGIGCSDVAVASMVATLFIAKTRG